VCGRKFPSLESIFQDRPDGESDLPQAARHAVDTKVWAIPSSNCAAHSVLAEWWRLSVAQLSPSDGFGSKLRLDRNASAQTPIRENDNLQEKSERLF
jgi:hypothetical protein